MPEIISCRTGLDSPDLDCTDRSLGLGQLYVSNLGRELACADSASNAVSDAKGRVPAFNLTLAITAVFAGAAAFAPSFGWLCCALFWVGTGIGGSMPTDGTLYVVTVGLIASGADLIPGLRFLENVPKTRHYLLTALSVL